MKKLIRFGFAPIILVAVLVISMTGILAYLFVAPDFVPPSELSSENNRNSPVWNVSFDDFIVYLQEKGLIGEKYDLISEGIATEARLYNNIEIYWWDVDSLIEGSDEYKTWNSMQEEGYILLYGQYVFVPEMNGPFGIYIQDTYTGDSDALRAAFQAFPEDDTASLPVWDCSYEDLISYLQSGGFIGEEYDELAAGEGVTARVYDDVELYRWDVENLKEGMEEYENWHSMQENGYMMIYGQHIFVPTMNGPFGMYIQETYTGDSDALQKAFKAFPKEGDKKQ